MAPLAVVKFAEELNSKQLNKRHSEHSAAVMASVGFFMSMPGALAAQTVVLNKLPRRLKGTTVPFAFAVAMAASVYKHYTPSTHSTNMTSAKRAMAE